MQSKQFRPIRKPAWKVRLKATGRGVKWERVIAQIECDEMGASGMKLTPKANGMAFAPHLIMTATINTEIAARLKEIARLLDEQEAKQFRVTAYRRAAETLKNLKRLLQFSARRRMMIWPTNQ
jgi:hypothetical protein